MGLGRPLRSVGDRFRKSEGRVTGDFPLSLRSTAWRCEMVSYQLWILQQHLALLLDAQADALGVWLGSKLT